MSNHKHVISRIQVINQCLSSGGYWSKERLLQKIASRDIDINPRTFDRDIDLMRNCGQLQYYAPITFCRQNRGYYYSDPDYSIDKIPLKEKDLEALRIAATTLSQYKYLPLMKEFETIVDRIIRVVNRSRFQNHESIQDFIYFEKTPVSLGLENVDNIIEAIQNKKPLKITYQKFGSKEASARIVHPYFLKEYRNRWYLIALDEKPKSIKTYGLDRIKSIEATDDIYIENKLLDKENFFKNCVGISLVDNAREKIVVIFAPKQAYYLKTQSIHSSQRVIEDHETDGLKVEFNLVVNYEFIGILLSYGSDVKVIEPIHLAIKVKEIATRIFNQYH